MIKLGSLIKQKNKYAPQKKHLTCIRHFVVRLFVDKFNLLEGKVQPNIDGQMAFRQLRQLALTKSRHLRLLGSILICETNSLSTEIGSFSGQMIVNLDCQIPI